MKYNTKIVDGYKVSFSSEWINDLESETHFNWYYHQAKLVYDNCLRHQSILEIGIGTGLLSDLLKRREWNIKTLDIDENKQPDFCENALDFNYREKSIETILAFEIFEHIPYITFEKIICKLSEDGISNIYFSLPWNEKCAITFKLKLPKLPPLNLSLNIPIGEINENNHFWEVSKKEKEIDKKKLVTLKNIEDTFIRHGYRFSCLQKIGNIQYFSALR